MDDQLGVSLGHTRLAVIDVETGQQPLFDDSKDIVLVCNGEIYDFERLRSELEEEGHSFHSRSDSEVIIQLYLKHGLGFTDYLRGEFAFVLLDRKMKRLIACRDRFGIKPLYVTRTDAGAWCFASEAKAIFAAGIRKPEIDLRNYYKNENGSLFRGIYNQPPATLMIVNLEDATAEVETYWNPDFPHENEFNHVKSIQEWQKDLDVALTEAIRLRMRSDVPLGVYLSGGIDSAIIAAKVTKLAGQPPLAYTVSFPGAPDGYDEGGPAQSIASFLGLEHEKIDVDVNSLWENLEACLWHNEAAGSSLTQVAKYLLSRRARERVKVVITGEGSDEVFLGYKQYRNMLDTVERRKVSKLPDLSKWFQQLLTRLRFSLVDWAVRGQYGGKQDRDYLYELLPRQTKDESQIKGRHPLIVFQYKWLKTNLRQITCRFNDRTEMAHAIEGRYPFLDHHLFAIAREIPIKYKIANGQEKYILRQCARDLLPDEILNRPKWPLSAPPLDLDDRQHVPAMDQILDRYMSRASIEAAGIVRWSSVQILMMLRRFSPLREMVDGWLFTICSLQILHSQFVGGGHALAPAMGSRPSVHKVLSQA